MKKYFLALMAVAAIAFVGCKPQNTPEGDEDNKKDTLTEVTCTSVKLYYTVEFAGKAADYFSLDIRYIQIPDTNKIEKTNLTSNWKYDEYNVVKGKPVYYGIEYTVVPTDLLKEAFADEAKHKEMVASESKAIVAMCEKCTFSDGRVEENTSCIATITLSTVPFDASKADEYLAMIAKPDGWAHEFLLDEHNYIHSHSVLKFWSRH